MSVLINFESIPINRKQQLADHLYVEPITKQQFNPVTKRMEKQKSNVAGIEAFDIIDTLDKDKYVCLPLSYYNYYLWDIPVTTTYKSENRSSSSLKFSGSLLDRQKDIRDDTFDILNRSNSVLLCLHTGFGKTIYTLYLLSKIKQKAIILCHRKIIIDQWCKSIDKYLPNAQYEILETKRQKPKDTTDILICNVINVPKWQREAFMDFGVCVVDEVHTICTEQFSKCLTMLFPDYLIGLSATPYRSDGMDRLLELYIGPEVVVKSMWRVFNAYKFKTGFTPEVEYQSDGKVNWNSVLESQAADPDRNEQIVNLTRWFKKKTILILVKRKDHALRLKRMILQRYPDEDVGVFMGTDKEVDFDSRILIATYSKGGVGFDHPRLDTLITAADVEENFMQYLGRVFRRDDVVPIYIDMVDDNSICARHHTSRKKIVESVGGTMIDFARVFKMFSKLK
jgi:superfamily II DNA or RNA helicase